MTEQQQQNPDVSLEELVINHAYEMVALIKVLEKKGLVSRAEIIEEINKLKA